MIEKFSKMNLGKNMANGSHISKFLSLKSLSYFLRSSKNSYVCYIEEAFKMTICNGSHDRTEILKMLFIMVPLTSIGFSSSKTA